MTFLRETLGAPGPDCLNIGQTCTFSILSDYGESDAPLLKARYTYTSLAIVGPSFEPQHIYRGVDTNANNRDRPIFLILGQSDGYRLRSSARRHCRYNPID